MTARLAGASIDSVRAISTHLRERSLNSSRLARIIVVGFAPTVSGSAGATFLAEAPAQRLAEPRDRHSKAPSIVHFALAGDGHSPARKEERSGEAFRTQNGDLGLAADPVLARPFRRCATSPRAPA